jgi:hypothetical protein
MITRETLHHLIEELPDADLAVAARVLQASHRPPTRYSGP